MATSNRRSVPVRGAGHTFVVMSILLLALSLEDHFKRGSRRGAACGLLYAAADDLTVVAQNASSPCRAFVQMPSLPHVTAAVQQAARGWGDVRGMATIATDTDGADSGEMTRPSSIAACSWLVRCTQRAADVEAGILSLPWLAYTNGTLPQRVLYVVRQWRRNSTLKYAYDSAVPLSTPPTLFRDVEVQLSFESFTDVSSVSGGFEVHIGCLANTTAASQQAARDAVVTSSDDAAVGRLLSKLSVDDVPYRGCAAPSTPSTAPLTRDSVDLTIDADDNLVLVPGNTREFTDCSITVACASPMARVAFRNWSTTSNHLVFDYDDWVIPQVSSSSGGEIMSFQRQVYPFAAFLRYGAYTVSQHNVNAAFNTSVMRFRFRGVSYSLISRLIVRCVNDASQRVAVDPAYLSAVVSSAAPNFPRFSPSFCDSQNPALAVRYGGPYAPTLATLAERPVVLSPLVRDGSACYLSDGDGAGSSWFSETTYTGVVDCSPFNIGKSMDAEDRLVALLTDFSSDLGTGLLFTVTNVHAQWRADEATRTGRSAEDIGQMFEMGRSLWPRNFLFATTISVPPSETVAWEPALPTITGSFSGLQTMFSCVPLSTYRLALRHVALKRTVQLSPYNSSFSTVMAPTSDGSSLSRPIVPDIMGCNPAGVPFLADLSKPLAASVSDYHFTYATSVVNPPPSMDLSAVNWKPSLVGSEWAGEEGCGVTMQCPATHRVRVMHVRAEATVVAFRFDGVVPSTGMLRGGSLSAEFSADYRASISILSAMMSYWTHEVTADVVTPAWLTPAQSVTVALPSTTRQLGSRDVYLSVSATCVGNAEAAAEFDREAQGGSNDTSTGGASLETVVATSCGNDNSTTPPSQRLVVMDRLILRTDVDGAGTVPLDKGMFLGGCRWDIQCADPKHALHLDNFSGRVELNHFFELAFPPYEGATNVSEFQRIRLTTAFSSAAIDNFDDGYETLQMSSLFQAPHQPLVVSWRKGDPDGSIMPSVGMTMIFSCRTTRAARTTRTTLRGCGGVVGLTQLRTEEVAIITDIDGGGPVPFAAVNDALCEWTVRCPAQTAGIWVKSVDLGGTGSLLMRKVRQYPTFWFTEGSTTVRQSDVYAGDFDMAAAGTLLWTPSRRTKLANLTLPYRRLTIRASMGDGFALLMSCYPVVADDKMRVNFSSIGFLSTLGGASGPADVWPFVSPERNALPVRLVHYGCWANTSVLVPLLPDTDQMITDTVPAASPPYDRVVAAGHVFSDWDGEGPAKNPPSYESQTYCGYRLICPLGTVAALQPLSFLSKLLIVSFGEPPRTAISYGRPEPSTGTWHALWLPSEALVATGGTPFVFATRNLSIRGGAEVSILQAGASFTYSCVDASVSSAVLPLYAGCGTTAQSLRGPRGRFQAILRHNISDANSLRLMYGTTLFEFANEACEVLIDCTSDADAFAGQGFRHMPAGAKRYVQLDDVVGFRDGYSGTGSMELMTFRGSFPEDDADGATTDVVDRWRRLPFAAEAFFAVDGSRPAAESEAPHRAVFSSSAVRLRMVPDLISRRIGFELRYRCVFGNESEGDTVLESTHFLCPPASQNRTLVGASGRVLSDPDGAGFAYFTGGVSFRRLCSVIVDCGNATATEIIIDILTAKPSRVELSFFLLRGADWELTEYDQAVYVLTLGRNVSGWRLTANALRIEWNSFVPSRYPGFTLNFRCDSKRSVTVASLLAERPMPAHLVAFGSDESITRLWTTALLADFSANRSSFFHDELAWQTSPTKTVGVGHATASIPLHLDQNASTPTELNRDGIALSGLLTTDVDGADADSTVRCDPLDAQETLCDWRIRCPGTLVPVLSIFNSNSQFEFIAEDGHGKATFSTGITPGKSPWYRALPWVLLPGSARGWRYPYLRSAASLPLREGTPYAGATLRPSLPATAATRIRIMSGNAPGLDVRFVCSAPPVFPLSEPALDPAPPGDMSPHDGVLRGIVPLSMAQWYAAIDGSPRTRNGVALLGCPTASLSMRFFAAMATGYSSITYQITVVKGATSAEAMNSSEMTRISFDLAKGSTLEPYLGRVISANFTSKDLPVRISNTHTEPTTLFYECVCWDASSIGGISKDPSLDSNQYLARIFDPRMRRFTDSYTTGIENAVNISKWFAEGWNRNQTNEVSAVPWTPSTIVDGLQNIVGAAEGRRLLGLFDPAQADADAYVHLILPPACFSRCVSPEARQQIAQCRCLDDTHCSRNGVAEMVDMSEVDLADTDDDIVAQTVGNLSVNSARRVLRRFIGRSPLAEKDSGIQLKRCRCVCNVGWTGLRCDRCADGFDPATACSTAMSLPPARARTRSPTRTRTSPVEDPSQMRPPSTEQQGSSEGDGLLQQPGLVAPQTAGSTRNRSRDVRVRGTSSRSASTSATSSLSGHQPVVQPVAPAATSTRTPVSSIGNSTDAGPLNAATELVTSGPAALTAAAFASVSAALGSSVIVDAQVLEIVAGMPCMSRGSSSSSPGPITSAMSYVAVGNGTSRVLTGVLLVLFAVSALHTAAYGWRGQQPKENISNVESDGPPSGDAAPPEGAPSIHTTSIWDAEAMQRLAKMRWPSLSVVAFVVLRQSLLFQAFKALIAVFTSTATVAQDLPTGLLGVAGALALPLAAHFLWRHLSAQAPLGLPADDPSSSAAMRDPPKSVGAVAGSVGGRVPVMWTALATEFGPATYQSTSEEFGDARLERLPRWHRLLLPSGRWQPASTAASWGGVAGFRYVAGRTTEGTLVTLLRDVLIGVTAQPAWYGADSSSCRASVYVIAAILSLVPVVLLARQAHRFPLATVVGAVHSVLTSATLILVAVASARIADAENRVNNNSSASMNSMGALAVALQLAADDVFHKQLSALSMLSSMMAVTAALAILVVGATTIATRKFHRSCAKEQLPAETELRSVNDHVTAASRCTDATAPLLSIPQSNPPATAPSLHSGDPLPAEPAGTTARSTNVVLPLPRLQPSWSTKVNPLSVNTRPPPSGAVSVATLL